MKKEFWWKKDIFSIGVEELQMHTLLATGLGMVLLIPEVFCDRDYPHFLVVAHMIYTIYSTNNIILLDTI